MKKILLILFVIILVAFVLSKIGSSPTPSSPESEKDFSFKNLQKIEVRGYDGNAMEPFISADGVYLFFNDFTQPKDKKHMHFAKKIDGKTFQYLGELPGVNTPSDIDGVPSMDNQNNFYLVSLRSFGVGDVFESIYRGKFTGERVENVELAGNIAEGRKFPWINMDAEISRDGKTLYVVDAYFEGVPLRPTKSDIRIMNKNGNGFINDSNSAEILKNINTKESLEYAPSISINGLELFFNRTTTEDLMKNQMAYILFAKRSNVSVPFEPPKVIDAIKGFVEGPTITSNSKTLYFHKLDGSKFYIYSVSRD